VHGSLFWVYVFLLRDHCLLSDNGCILQSSIVCFSTSVKISFTSDVFFLLIVVFLQVWYDTLLPLVVARREIDVLIFPIAGYVTAWGVSSCCLWI
jgi:hypothetical protein